MSDSTGFNEQYDELEKLGNGAFSTVYRGKDMATGKLVAIKVIDKTSCDYSSFKNEFLIQREFESPYIIDLYSYFEDDDNFYMVMEYANAGALFDIINQTTYSENDAATIIQQVLIGLKVLHDNKIIHGDLKPENILLSIDDETDEYTAKISDFGLASIFTGEKKDLFQGTMTFEAPEIIERKPYDPSIDMWSLGVIIYILLSGDYPFESEDEHQLMKKIGSGDYDFSSYKWDDISDEGKDFISQLLQVNPKNRITIENALKHPWVTGNAPKIELPDLRTHLKKFNLQRKLKRVTNTAKSGLLLKKISKKKISKA